tara:strand:- start:7494 stop:8495 length:1002 start_codon:yes stop_codon:yes gene_type:complete
MKYVNVMLLLVIIILILLCISNINVVEKMSCMVSEKKKISSNFSAKQCQDNCFNDGSKYGCKYAIMDIGLSSEGGKGNCWNTYGREQIIGESPLISRQGKPRLYNPPWKDTSNRGGTDRLLGPGEGDCDRDSQCLPGLKCKQRKSFEKVPGHTGEGKKGWDYCYATKQMTGEGDCYNEYEIWENKEYKQPPPEEKTKIITNNGYWNRGRGATGYRGYQSYKKTHYISGGKSVKIKKIEVEQVSKDQGWGNKTKPSYVYLKNENGEYIKGTIVGRRGWLPRVRGWRSKGKKSTDEKIFPEPYIQASSITVRIDSRGQGHRNVTSSMKIKITYLD